MIYNLNYSTSAQNLGEALESFGPIEFASILTERIRGVKRSRGIGVVNFVNVKDAQRCLETRTMHLDGRNIIFCQALPPRPKNTAFFGHLPATVDEYKILALLKKDEVESIKIIPQRERPSGFAYVTFKREEYCVEAIYSLKGAKIDGSDIIVRFAKPPQRIKRRRFNRRPTGPRRGQIAE